MAGNDSSQEKTEEATPKKLREARKKGQVPKSKDLSTIFVMVIVFVTIAFSGGHIANEMKMLMQNIFELFDKTNFNGNDMMSAGKMAVMAFIRILGPIFIAGVAAALLIGFLQVGPMFSAEVLKPKFEKLNPIEGAKNMFKMKTFIELIKNMLKLSLVVYLAYYTINDYMLEILLSPKVNIVESVSMTAGILSSFFIKVFVVFFVIAIADMAIQRWNHMKEMRMTKDEVKREYKQDEGDPQIKQERRRIHRDMVFGDAKQNVKKADAVVSNPIHVAIAIQYNRDDMGAPEVLLKGQRRYAEMILEVAREEGVPIIRNIPLAWSLLAVEEGDVIPEDLYEPVAEILSLVYEMREQSSQYQEDQVFEKDDDKPSSFDPLG
jgi:flagellar biosynthesis protein FlhB